MASTAPPAGTPANAAQGHPTSEQILAQAKQYVQWEADADYRATISGLIEKNDVKALEKEFHPRIAFGTAGLRAKMAAGYHNMNALVVTQTSQGFARYMETFHGANGGDVAKLKASGVVIGYDGRHHSREYALCAAGVFVAAGFKVHLYSKMVATPFVPFGVTYLKAAAGVMVTASHNPKEDNGYKVYWQNGAQIIPPHDGGIAEAILKPENQKPWHLASLTEGAKPTLPPFDDSNPLVSDPFDTVTKAYFDLAKRDFNWTREANEKLTQESCPLAYTAMHGVGSVFTARALEVFGLPRFHPTAIQDQPDAEFPTVKFPNPEEGKGALKEAMASADKAGARVIVANDPDADRMAVAEKVKGADGNDAWQPLNGNQIALLLADWSFRNHVRLHKPSKEDLAKTCMIASTVSSAILGAMARKEGFKFFPTLTGFKWMGNRAQEAVRNGMTFLFAFEVEIGFLIGSKDYALSYDKDGVRTAASFYELYADLHSRGVTLHQHLQKLYEKYGFFSMRTSYFFCPPESGKMNAIFARLRSYPGVAEGTWPGTEHKYPTSVGGVKIESVRDVTYGYDSSEVESKYVSALPRDTSSSMLTFRFASGATCTLRNSGTEPKIKYYVECSSSSDKEATEQVEALTKAVIQELIQPKENGLEAPPSA